MALGTTTALADIANLEAQGRGVQLFSNLAATGGMTAGTNAIGNFTLCFMYNSIGSTLYTTFQDIPIQGGLTGSPLRLKNFQVTSNRAMAVYLARAYRFGTVSLSTGTFTHDAATFPVNRTQMGSSQALDLLPILQVTTAPATTAPAFTFSYTNQANGAVTGTITNTLPSATTAAGSCFLLRMEIGDNAVNDITAMSFSATGTAGAATLWGVELYGLAVGNSVRTDSAKNSVIKGFSIPNINPATATSGTATTQLVPINVLQNLTTTTNIQINLFEDI